MTRVRERRPEQRIQAQVNAQKEEKLGRVKQGCKASRKGAKGRTRMSGIGAFSFFHQCHERHANQKKRLSASCVLPADPGSDLRSVSAISEFRYSGARLPRLPVSGARARGSGVPAECPR